MEIKTVDDIFGMDFVERERLSGKFTWNDGKNDVKIALSAFDINNLQVEGRYINPYSPESDFSINLDYKTTEFISLYPQKYSKYGFSKLDVKSFTEDTFKDFFNDEGDFNDEADTNKLSRYLKCAEYSLHGYLRLAKQFAREKLGIIKFSPRFKEVIEARRGNSWKRFIEREKGICQCNYAVVFPIKEIEEKGIRKRILY